MRNMDLPYAWSQAMTQARDSVSMAHSVPTPSRSWLLALHLSLDKFASHLRRHGVKLLALLARREYSIASNGSIRHIARLVNSSRQHAVAQFILRLIDEAFWHLVTSGHPWGGRRREE